MDFETLTRYDRPLPRYTSYPTAPHFDTAITGETYAAWLTAVPPDQPVSLYLHIPFCDSLCWFCGCHTKITQRYAPIAAYLEHLIGEIDRVAGLIPGRPPVSRIHWGGGSPTILEPADFLAISRAIDARFDRTAACETSVEIDPRGLDQAMVDALAAAGVNRASIGLQDINPDVQAAVNRYQSLAETETVLSRLRAAGILRNNIDLMYGLPRQSVDDVARSTQAAVDLGADRIALFGYAHVPWMKRHQRLINEDELPDGRARWQATEAAATVLLQAGYTRIGLDHFARPDDPMAVAQAAGRLRRNFQGYTDDQARTLIGFGASAIGELPDGYVQNQSPIHGWSRTIAEGGLATVRGFALDDQDRLSRAVIERLMCDMSVDLAELAGEWGADPAIFDDEIARLAPLEGDGLAVRGPGRTITIPEDARALMRVVAAGFDRYLGRSAGRHSRAV